MFPAPRARTVGTSSYGAAVLDSQVDRILHSVRGERHDATFKASLKTGSFAAGNEVAETAARALLIAAATERGLAHSDAVRHVDRGLARGRLQPRSAPTGGKITQDARQAREQALAAWQAIRASNAKAGTKKIALVLAHQLFRHGRSETGQSFRQLARLTGMSTGTVCYHRRHLAAWFRYIPPAELGHAGTWRLLPVDRPVVDLTAVNMPDPAANYWHRKPGEWLAYAGLSITDEVTFEELAASCGRGLRTVKGYVKRWVAAGLAVVTATGITAVADAELPATTVDYAHRREVRHAGERRTFKRWVQAQVARREHEATLPVEEQRRLEAARKVARVRRFRWPTSRAGFVGRAPDPVFREHMAA